MALYSAAPCPHAALPPRAAPCSPRSPSRPPRRPRRFTAPLKPCYVTAGTQANAADRGLPGRRRPASRPTRTVSTRDRRRRPCRTARALAGRRGGQRCVLAGHARAGAVDQGGPARLHGHADRSMVTRRTWRPRRRRSPRSPSTSSRAWPSRRTRSGSRAPASPAPPPCTRTTSTAASSEDRPDGGNARGLRHLVGEAQADPRAPGEDRPVDRAVRPGHRYRSGIKGGVNGVYVRLSIDVRIKRERRG